MPNKTLTKNEKDILRKHLSISLNPDNFGERLTENQIIIRATMLIDKILTSKNPRETLIEEITGISLKPPKNHTSAKTLFGGHHD